MCWAPVMYKSLYKELAKDRQYKDRISALSGFLILWKMQTCHSSQIKYKYIIKVHDKNYRHGWEGDQLSVGETWMAFELDLKGKWMWEGHLEIGVY